MLHVITTWIYYNEIKYNKHTYTFVHKVIQNFYLNGVCASSIILSYNVLDFQGI